LKNFAPIEIMKKKIRLAICGLLAAATATITAGATNFDTCADKLKALDLFQGTGESYALDRAPTRAEAAVMLVRLLGQENAAKQSSYTAPFTDVADWQKPYVQYLYEHQLATVPKDNKFNPNQICSAQMYTTFLLRALGYQESAGDFSYDKALSFGEEQGLVDFFNCDTDNFLRDHVAAMSLTALHMPVKGTENNLLDQLISDGAVSAEKASGIKQLFNTYDAYTQATEKSAAMTKGDFTVNIDMSAKMGENTMVALKMPLNMKMDVDLEHLADMQMIMTGTMNMEMSPLLTGGATEDNTLNVPIAYYFKDGNYYMNAMDQKIKMAFPMDEMLSQIGDINMMSTKQETPLSLLKDITKTNDTFTLRYNMNAVKDFAMKLVEKSMQEALPEDITKEEAAEVTAVMSNFDLQMNDMTAEVSIANDTLSAMKANLSGKLTVEGMTLDLAMNLDYTVNAQGDAVVLTFPDDLETYQDIGGATGGTLEISSEEEAANDAATPEPQGN